MKPIIFTDIDGTLIDFQTYSITEALLSVTQLTSRDIPIILCSSKTRQEQEHYRKIFGLSTPFIVENGSAIYIPKATFSFAFLCTHETDLYFVIETGIRTQEIRTILNRIRYQTGLSFIGYADLTLHKICELTELPPSQADSASHREYSETILSPLSNTDLTRLRGALVPYGLQIQSGGHFYTVTSLHINKGHAVQTLSALYRQKYGNITTIGLGDSANDHSLLASVDHPCLVQKPDQTWHPFPDIVVNKIPGIGPAGWRIAVELLIKETTPVQP